MKRQFYILIFLLVTATAYTSVNAQSVRVSNVEEAIKKDGKYAILVPNARYFQAAVNSGKNLKAKNPEIEFEIVLISSVTKDLATDESLIPFIELSEKLGIKIVVCEFAMNHFEIKKSDYHPSIKTTPDGFAYIFGLQELGFKTITL